MSQTQQYATPAPRGRNGGAWTTSPTSLSSLDLLDGPGGQVERDLRPESSPVRADIRALSAGYCEPEGLIASRSAIRLWRTHGLTRERSFAGPSTTPYALRIEVDEWRTEASSAISCSSVATPVSFPELRSGQPQTLHPRNQRLLETLGAMASQPDTLGSAWWEAFREALQRDRLHLRNAAEE